MRVLFRPERRCNQRLLKTAEALRQEMVQVRDGPIGRAPSRRAKVRFQAAGQRRVLAQSFPWTALAGVPAFHPSWA